jgi:hypothetical protein
MSAKTLNIILVIVLVFSGIWIYQLNQQIKSDTQNWLLVNNTQISIVEKIKDCLSKDKQMDLYQRQQHQNVSESAGARYYLLIVCLEEIIK